MPTVSVSPELLLLPARALTPQLPSKQDIRIESSGYVARLALTPEDRAAAFRLRFVVFNLELQEGLESAYLTGYDTDRYDDICDHLIVESRATGEVVGTYRMQMAPWPATTSATTANRSSTSHPTRVCAIRLQSWAAPASIATIAPPMSSICCGAASRATSWSMAAAT